MTRTVLTAVLVVMLGVLVGCHGIDSGRGQLLPSRPRALPGYVIKGATAGEIDIIEQMSVNRQSYCQGLESLVEYYARTGNSMKLRWAKRELKALDSAAQYNYIIEASLAGPDLKASTLIPEADSLYYEALQIEKTAGRLIVIKNENLLRVALDKYNQLIRKHPSSDKVDDAAYKAGGIYEYFKDYTIALLYYQRTYQWNPDTIYPAKFKAAYILDKKLHRRAEALELYQQALKRGGLSKNYREFAEKRIMEFTRIGEGGE